MTERDIFDRAFEVASAVLPPAPRDRLAHPFGFGPHEARQWRVSRDVWDALMKRSGWKGRDPDPTARLLGEPITVDDGLPANSMILGSSLNAKRKVGEG